MAKARFKVDGLHCNSCIAVIKDHIEELSGINRVSGDLDKKVIVVEYDDYKATKEMIRSVIIERGYSVQ